jgi:hypothetical protein
LYDPLHHFLKVHEDARGEIERDFAGLGQARQAQRLRGHHASAPEFGVPESVTPDVEAMRRVVVYPNAPLHLRRQDWSFARCTRLISTVPGEELLWPFTREHSSFDLGADHVAEAGHRVLYARDLVRRADATAWAARSCARAACSIRRRERSITAPLLATLRCALAIAPRTPSPPAARAAARSTASTAMLAVRPGRMELDEVVAKRAKAHLVARASVRDGEIGESRARVCSDRSVFERRWAGRTGRDERGQRE